MLMVYHYYANDKNIYTKRIYMGIFIYRVENREDNKKKRDYLGNVLIFPNHSSYSGSHFYVCVFKDNTKAINIRSFGGAKVSLDTCFLLAGIGRLLRILRHS